MKVPGKILLIVLLIMLPLVSLTGCKELPPTNPDPKNLPSINEEKTVNEQQTAETAPAFSLADLYTGKNIQIPADIKGSKAAVVFFSLT